MTRNKKQSEKVRQKVTNPFASFVKKWYCNHGIFIKNDVDEEININTELGCDKCEDTGYYGRTAIYEILEINENLKHDINNWTNSCNIASIAIENEMITFEDSAKYLIENYITTQEECGLLEGI